MRFRVLGPLQVWTGSAWSPIRAGQQRVLLAVLLADAGRVVTTDRLIDEIWGDRPPRSAVTTLQGYVARLRRLLGGGTDGPLATRDRGYELTLPDGDVDAIAFRALVTEGQRALAAGDLDDALARLTGALALWRGPALSDVPASHTVTGYANRLEQAKLDAIETRLDVLLARDHHADVAVQARALVEEHPLRERLWAQLMRALYRSARRAEALDTYRRAREVLRAELGLEPGPELRELQQAILSDAAQPDDAAGPGTEVGQVTPAQLPAGVADFTGRQLPLKRLDELLDTPLVTIVGAPGVGKTALAIHWGHRIRDLFPEGQLYLNLRGFASGAPLRPVEALGRLLSGLGVPNDSVPVDEEEAAVRYRSLLAGKRMLVLLDNARDADQVRPLLPGYPGCLAVVTSRDRLDGLAVSHGAVRLDLDVLPVDEAHALLAGLLGRLRVAAEPAAATELARLCGHLPLALRIAAANLTGHPHATIGDYTGRLRADRLAALEIVGEPTGGVRAALDHSYTSLPDQARRLFRLLGLVPGPDLTAAAAAALADLAPPQAAALLDRLASANLIEEHANHRYALHDLVRDYAAGLAREELTGADRSAAAGRLCDFYLSGVDAASRCLYPEILRLPVPPALAGDPVAGLDEPASALSWLDAERSNLVAAVSSGVDHGVPSAAWRLADALRGYLMLHRHTLEWSDVARAGLAAAEADGDVRGRAAAHLSLAGLHWLAARREQALENYRSALALARRAEWAEGEAATLGNLGLLHWLSGEPGRAADHFTAALALDERTGRLASRATNLSNLGLVSGALGRLALAVEHLSEARDCFRRVGSRGGEAGALANLGETYQLLGRLDEASEVLGRALAVHRDTGEQRAEAEATRFLACVRRDLGRSAEALELAGTAVRLAREADDRHGEAEALVAQASVLDERGEHAAAADGYQRALRLARRDRYRYTEAAAQIGLATAWLHLGRVDEAIDSLSQALAIARPAGFRLLEGNALTVLAGAELRRGEPARALELAGQALTIHTECGLRRGEAQARRIAAEARGEQA